MHIFTSNFSQQHTHEIASQPNAFHDHFLKVLKYYPTSLVQNLMRNIANIRLYKYL